MMCIKKILQCCFFLSVLTVSFTDPAVFELKWKTWLGMLQYTENIQMCLGKYGNPGISSAAVFQNNAGN